MSEYIVANVRMYFSHCPNCGVYYGIPKEKRDKCEDNGDSWQCPNGHGVIVSENNLTKLKKEKEKSTMYHNWYREGIEKLSQRDNLIRTLRGHITRLKKKYEQRNK